MFLFELLKGNPHQEGLSIFLVVLLDPYVNKNRGFSLAKQMECPWKLKQIAVSIETLQSFLVEFINYYIVWFVNHKHKMKSLWE